MQPIEALLEVLRSEGAARLFGMPSVRVTGPGDLGDAVAGIEAPQGPVLVEVPVTGHRSAGGQGTAGP